LEGLDNAGKMTSETEQAMLVNLEFLNDNDDDDDVKKVKNLVSPTTGQHH
jgi:hypothetical protein